MTLSVPSVTTLPTDASKDRDASGCGAGVGSWATGASSLETAPSSVGSSAGVAGVVCVFGVVRVGAGTEGVAGVDADIATAV